MREPTPLFLIVFTLLPVAFVVGLCWAAVLILRWTGLSRPGGMRAGSRVVSPWTWRLILYAVASFVAARASTRLLPGPMEGRVAVGVFVAVFGVLVLATLATSRGGDDRAYRRAVRLANAGDIPGAIAALQGALDLAAPPAAPASAASPGPADPWAPPRVAIRPDARAAHRLNLMGRLVGSQGDWAAAEGWFRRAEAAGGPEPVFRLNLGLARVKLGDEADGFAAMRAALADAPAHLPIHRFEFALVLGRALAEAGHAAEARARLDEAAAALQAAEVYPQSARWRLEGAIAAARATPPPPGVGAAG